MDATLRNETQWTNETLGGGVGGNVGTHRLQAAAAEQRDEQRDTEVVELLAQSQAVAVQAVGQGVELSAAQARAEGARTLLRILLAQQRRTVKMRNLKPPAKTLAVVLEDVGAERVEAQVNCGRDQLEGDRRTTLQLGQDVHQREAVLPAGETDENAVARTDHAEADNGMGRVAAKTAEQVKLAERRGRHGRNQTKDKDEGGRTPHII